MVEKLQQQFLLLIIRIIMFVVPMMKHPIWFITALIIGSLITGVTYAALKRPNTDVDNNDESELDNVDINIGE